MRPIPITNRDHTPEELEQMTRDCNDLCWARRLRAVVMVLRGASRRDAAEANVWTYRRRETGSNCTTAPVRKGSVYRPQAIGPVD